MSKFTAAPSSKLSSSSSSLTVLNDTPLPDDIMDVTKSRIRRSDATSMLLRKIDRNERPYIRVVLEGNNRIVEQWDDTVLRKIVDKDGALPSCRVERSLTTFKEGIEVSQYIVHQQYIPVPSQEQIDYWINFFRTTTMEDLHNAGPFVVAAGWSVLRSAIQNFVANEKWEKIYSQTHDPVKREKLRDKHPELSFKDRLPFGLSAEECNDFGLRVSTLSSIRIEPQSQ